MLDDPLAHSLWRERVPLLAAGAHIPILHTVMALRSTHTIYPPQDAIFAALLHTPPDSVRVVIVGQDPYHGPHQAHGLAFSVQDGIRSPRSLQNMFKEISNDVYGGASLPDASTDLRRWARQGVLLCNTILTVEDAKPGAHAHLGWQAISKAVLEAVAQGTHPVAALLWGKQAQAYAPIFADSRHLCLQAAHPSPLSATRGFFGCGHFSAVNRWLVAQGLPALSW